MKNKIPLLMTALLISSCSSPINIDINPNKAKSLPFSFINPDLPSLNPISSSSLSSPLSSSNQTSYTAEDDYFYCPHYGPFPLGSADFSSIFYYRIYSAPSQRIIERIRVFNATNNSVLSASSKASKNYSQGTLTSVSFSIPLYDYWTNDGLTLFFEIINSETRQIIKQYSVSFYPPSNRYIKQSDLKNEIYVSKSLGFYANGKTFMEIKETYDFTSIGDYLNIDYYYLLDIRKNKFKYSSLFTLSDYSMELRFEDYDNQFPYFNHDSNDFIRMPLTLSIENEEVTIRYAKTLYINKKTLEMSETYRSGYELTDQFYLPINGKRLFNGKPLYLEIYHLGKDNISTYFILRYDVDRSYIGLCGDGDYCVIGGRK